MMSVDGVKVDEERLAATADRYGIAELRIFGSRARGTARPDSHIDILYSLQPGHRLGWEIEQLADKLGELFGRHVNLVSTRSLHPLLRESVLAEARRLRRDAAAAGPPHALTRLRAPCSPISWALACPRSLMRDLVP